jgi:hypothetical protein
MWIHASDDEFKRLLDLADHATDKELATLPMRDQIAVQQIRDAIATFKDILANPQQHAETAQSLAKKLAQQILNEQQRRNN